MGRHYSNSNNGAAGAQIFYPRCPDLINLRTDQAASRIAKWSPPALEEYQAWVDEKPNRASRRSPSAAQICRLIIIVRHEGVTISLAAKRMCLNPTTCLKLVARLPDHLK